MSQVAFLSNDKKFTSFEYAGHNICFRTSERLEYYTEVKEWDHGYIVVMAKYEGEGYARGRIYRFNPNIGKFVF